MSPSPCMVPEDEGAGKANKGVKNMAARTNRDSLWEVGCEGHTDAWVVAADWPLATVEAARFWDVPWRTVAAACVCKQRIQAPPRNVCCRCGKIFYGSAHMCDACLETVRTEEQLLQRARRRAYRTGKLV